jgi:hypothetical protein
MGIRAIASFSMGFGLVAVPVKILFGHGEFCGDDSATNALGDCGGISTVDRHRVFLPLTHCRLIHSEEMPSNLARATYLLQTLRPHS